MKKGYVKMAKFSKKGWSSDFSDRNFTGDQLERYKDGLRDNLYGRHDSASRLGKNIHQHKSFREAPPQFTPDEMLATLIEAAKRGDTQSQFRVGVALANRGDMEQARKWLKIAADKNWPGAMDKYEELFGKEFKKNNPVKPVQQPRLRCAGNVKKPCVQQYRVFPLPFSPGKFYVAVKVDDSPYWYHIGLVAAEYGLTVPLVYEGYEVAELGAKKLMEILSRGDV